VVPADACVAGAAPLLDLRRVRESARTLPPAFADTVAAVLEVSGLTYFPRLNTAVIVEAAEAWSGDGFSPDDRFLDTVVCTQGDSPYRYAEDLAARSAARFWFSFLLARPDPRVTSHGVWISPWSGNQSGTVRMATEVLASSVRYRMRERVLGRAPHLLDAGERSSLRTSLAPLKAQLLEMTRFVDQIEESLAQPMSRPEPADNNMDVADLLCTLFPGPNQFHKYWRGGAAGSAE